MENSACTRIQPQHEQYVSPDERPYDRSAVEGVTKAVLALSAAAGVLWVVSMVYTLTVWALSG
ncbi:MULTISPECIES: hypothetical protein [Streptomyces]|uniref:Uncharacterized protein n=1 Tax=Streptomyces lycii TaxID=2654337 RepID=A0ABQ7FF98_9ACTN|nr:MULTISPECIES: hypothetical protein [Streptomyces]KAF4406339.1 hypothetical protein GCU69_25505 [Streptomyces lycii]